jgi:sugar lactone lactonase YvrE
VFAAALVASPAVAQESAQHLLVLDQDAHAVSAEFAGALYNMDLSQPSSTLPALEIGADTGAGIFQGISGVAISPWDGSAYISDVGPPGTNAPDGAIYRHEQGSGAISTIVAAGHPLLYDPFQIAFHEDGRLLVADWESDPSGFGPDWVGGLGHGGVFWVDPVTGTVTLISDGTNHDVPGIDPAESVFQDPIGIAWDPVRELIYVADFSADGDNDGFFNGTLFSVDPANGQVRVVSAYWNFAAPIACAVRANGRPLVLDSVEDDSLLLEVDPGIADLTDNVNFITAGAGGQYYLLEGLTVDENENIWVVDLGEWDDVDLEFIVPPGVYRVDESQRGIDPDFDLNNAIPVVDWIDGADTILSPVALAAVPLAHVDAVSPRSVIAPTVVTMEGAQLHPGLDFDFGGAVTVSGVSFVPGRNLGTAVEMTLSPNGGADCSPSLIPRHPFGGGITFEDVVNLASVDGLDLGILGRAFGAGVCEIDLFDNDADFNNDDLIDGLDLSVLMTYFGTTP